MIIQISMCRNELTLIRELLPIWKKYADGFVFMLDTNTDDTKEYLESVKSEYNILEILEVTEKENVLKIETDLRQELFDAAFKYSNKIICLDADEYLDGNMSKSELEEVLNDEVTIFLDWLQYTSCNTIRVDGVWKNNIKDRIGSYNTSHRFSRAQMHSTHLPIAGKSIRLEREKLFIAHLAWLDKKHVAVKQYYWKVVDFLTRTKFNEKTATIADYDASVNNFEWQEQYVNFPLKINSNIFKKINLKNNYKLKIINEYTFKHQIPDLGSWGYDFKNLQDNDEKDANVFDITVITALGDLNTYEKFIERYIENVKEQHSFFQTEHIIIYKEWSSKFDIIKNCENFKLVKETGSTGVYNAWNLGIKNSTTKFITNWNIDDLRHPLNNKLKYDVLTKNPQYDVVYNYYVATKNINENFKNLDMNNKRYLNFPDEYEKYCMEACLIGPDPMWKKSLHTASGYFDQENFSSIGDWEMWIRFAKKGAKFKLIPEILCIYFDHEKTVSHQGTINGISQNQIKKLKELYD
jgi:hypothetical protein